MKILAIICFCCLILLVLIGCIYVFMINPLIAKYFLITMTVGTFLSLLIGRTLYNYNHYGLREAMLFFVPTILIGLIVAAIAIVSKCP